MDGLLAQIDGKHKAVDELKERVAALKSCKDCPDLRLPAGGTTILQVLRQGVLKRSGESALIDKRAKQPRPCPGVRPAAGHGRLVRSSPARI